MSTDYRKLYAMLCAAASDALDKLPMTPDTALARQTLEQALLKAEACYVQSTNGEED